MSAAVADRSATGAADAEGATSAALERYLAAHAKVRADDDGGNWDGAVSLATGGGDANRTFTSFESTSARALATQAKHVSDDLAHARGPLSILSVLVLIAGVAAAVGAQRGMARRLREYQ